MQRFRAVKLFLCCAGLVLIGLPALLHAQNATKIGTAFFSYLNHFQRDSLAQLLTSDFVLKRNYVAVQTDRKSFLTDYFDYSQNLEGQFIPIQPKADSLTYTTFVKDHSIYFTCLSIKEPTWKFTLLIRNDSVAGIKVDSVNSYQDYLKETTQKEQLFMAWLNKAYPSENWDQLYQTNGLLVKRLKQYAKQRDK